MNIEKESFLEMQDINNQSNEDYELDLIEFVKGLLRNKIIILPILLFFSSLGLVESMKTKDIWQGEFQIVLKENDNNSGAGLEGLERLSAFMTNSPTSDLQTSVEILKSPSVLMPVLDFIKNEKKLLGKDIDNLSFKSWIKKSLRIELEGGTSILNLDYKDTDKDLILPVLEKISSIYQDYSVKQIKSNISQEKEYLRNQIKEYNFLTQNSIVDLQKYSEDYDILIPNANELKLDLQGNSNKLNNYLLLMNSDNDIKFKIKEIKDNLNLLDNNSYKDNAEILLMASTIDSSEITKSLIQQLKDLELIILKKGLNYKLQDPLIINLNEQRNFLYNEIKVNTRNDLKAQLEIYENIKNNNSKPKNVIAKFRELFGSAIRNSITLQSLEKELHVTTLAEARTKKPWKLITNPTLLDQPVGPVRSFIFMQKLFTGLLIGSIISIIYDLKKNLIYSENKIRKIVNLNLIETFSSNKLESWENDINILNNGLIKKDNSQSLSIITMGNIKQEHIETIDNQFKKLYKKSNFLITKDILDAKKFENVLLITAKGSISKEELTKLINKISIQKMNLLGWILID